MSKMRQIRKDRKLSQQKIADATNVARQFISAIECGTDNAPAWLAEAIAKALGVDLTEIFKVESERIRYKVIE